MTENAHTPLTEAELNAIEARCEAATPGPWKQSDCGYDVCSKNIPSACDNSSRMTIARCMEGDSRPYTTAYKGACKDAEFIAHARTDLPRLLAAYRELKAENERLENEIGAKNERLKAAAYDLGRSVGFMSATRDRIDEYVKTFPEVPTPAPPEKEET